MSSKAAAGRACAQTLRSVYNFLVQHPQSSKNEILRVLPGKSSRSAYDKLKYLERCGLVKFGTEVSITKKGYATLTESNVWDITIPRPAQWDGKWHIVTFDIPKDKRKTRDVFRSRLKELGFVLYQNSVWILPNRCEEEIRMIAHFYKIEKYICFITAQKVSNELTLRKHFAL